ncbi:DUF5672 family protein [Mucilaginibacter lacusdianchii]|uniref:DUF5672 family protein n=1 Tax=Mucilaginibacter lacusdianchii TaxID=2684211 RepID=UPI00131B9B58|nr:DUF5672 family protein [Mucilaginibacter sp. JXJ CY 39]
MQNKLVTVVIPIHLEEPPELEKISLAQTLSVLHNFPITFMATANLDTSWYENFCRGKAVITFERFDWKGHGPFGELMTSHLFYKRFLNYQYMLICHLDAFVFRNELEKWCDLGYDYIGSVIYNTFWHGRDGIIHKLAGFKYPEYFGNGGFALKKVSTFYRITFEHRRYIAFFHWVRKLRKQGFLNDLFFCQHFPKLSSSFSMPPKHIAQQFGAAYENWPETDLPFNNRQTNSLPFGIHGWIQYQFDFWKPVISRYKYQLDDVNKELTPWT